MAGSEHRAVKLRHHPVLFALLSATLACSALQPRPEPQATLNFIPADPAAATPEALKAAREILQFRLDPPWSGR